MPRLGESGESWVQYPLLGINRELGSLQTYGTAA
jgi:hypothetical protein